MEPAYYRERSPSLRTRQRPVYTGHSPDVYHDRIRLEEPITYTRVPPHGQYQYLDDSRYTDPSYDGAVEYIPVRVAAREHQNTGPYYIERSVHREVPKEYVDYEMDYPRQSVLEHRGQYYPSGTMSQNGQTPPDTLPRPTRYR
jgi:hypothetical protein